MSCKVRNRIRLGKVQDIIALNLFYTESLLIHIPKARRRGGAAPQGHQLSYGGGASAASAREYVLDLTRVGHLLGP